MRKMKTLVPMLFAFVLFAVGVSLAAPTPESKDSAKKATTKVNANTKPSASKSAAKSQAKSSARSTRHVLASNEDLSGTIAMVDPAGKEVTLVGSNGIPYDFILTNKTRGNSPTTRSESMNWPAKVISKPPFTFFRDRTEIWPRTSRSRLPDLLPSPAFSRMDAGDPWCLRGLLADYAKRFGRSLSALWSSGRS